jgi:hypothetical protein
MFIFWEPDIHQKGLDHIKKRRTCVQKKIPISRIFKRTTRSPRERMNEMLGRPRSGAGQLPTWAATRPEMSA